MFGESVIFVTLVAGIAARFVRSYHPRQEALVGDLAALVPALGAVLSEAHPGSDERWTD
jgi:hypothetical protein